LNILLTLSEVESSFFHHFCRGTKFNQENLLWSFEAVRNSCNKELQAILDAKMLKYGPSEQFFPLYYFQLVHHMTSMDPKAVRAITQELTTLKVTDYEGESIASICKLIRSTVIWLDIVKMTPPDLYTIIFDILETCTVHDFRLFLKTFATSASLNGNTISVEELLTQAEEQYCILILAKRWNAGPSQASSFQANQQSCNSPT
jgi:uncharacterized protein YfkK (UPF0435 family)